MLSPKGDVEQSVGRIQRQLVSEREYIPLIYDIVDNFSIFKNQAKKRYKSFKLFKRWVRIIRPHRN